ncbi:hypothetical protein SVI_1090 [Shewanella violacea DSS12]|uniref:Uncharacterized protein n=1 Tax=Shewanella violacea (strain JCM 10179 / CIP 106290 / LMG 19151 / DSS12) TaxID=637905 RepID=D4ZHB2_SHEVD|nr:hypothetical protein SVI_1090 [Shewanella violacea DSS12]
MASKEVALISLRNVTIERCSSDVESDVGSEWLMFKASPMGSYLGWYLSGRIITDVCLLRIKVVRFFKSLVGIGSVLEGRSCIVIYCLLHFLLSFRIAGKFTSI